jgi:purine-cytosine permease-like protein
MPFVTAAAALLIISIIVALVAAHGARVLIAISVTDLLFGPATFVWSVVSFARSFEGVAHVTPADKAVVLSAGISEAMNDLALGALTTIPVAIAGGLLLYKGLDRKRATSRSS